MNKLENHAFDSHNTEEQPKSFVSCPNNLMNELDLFAANDKRGCDLITAKELLEVESEWYENIYHGREFIDFFKKKKPQGSDLPIFLFEKRLENLDVDTALNRLSNRENGKLVKFMTEDEKNKLFNMGRRIQVSATIDGDQVKSYNLQLQIWGDHQWMVLNQQWSNLVEDNKLMAGDHVQFWGYRDENMQMCFNLTVLKAAYVDNLLQLSLSI